MSSSYDSALVDTAMIEDPRLLRLERSIRLVYFEALVWSKARRQDGEIPRGALRRLTDEEDADHAAAELVRVGIWEATDNGWQVVDFRASQMVREDVERKVRQARDARRRYEERNPNRPRRGQRDSTDASRDGSGEASASLPARPPARAGQVGNAGGPGPDGPAAALGMVNGRPLTDVSRELVDEFPDRYASETIAGHLGGRGS